MGEAKFHKGISGAISSSLKSLKEHLNDSERIKSELKLLGGEIEVNRDLDSDTHELLKSYVAGGKSLDKVNIAVPVLLTYDSQCISKFTGYEQVDIDSKEFRDALKIELEGHFTTIYGKDWPSRESIRVVFFVAPFESVSDLKEKIEQVEIAMKF